MTLGISGTPACLYPTPTRHPPSQAAVSCVASQGVELVPLRVMGRHPTPGSSADNGVCQDCTRWTIPGRKGLLAISQCPGVVGGWAPATPCSRVEPVWKTTVKHTYREWQRPLGLRCRTLPAGRAPRARLVQQVRGRPSALLDRGGTRGPWHQPGPGSWPPGRWSPPRRGHL